MRIAPMPPSMPEIPEVSNAAREANPSTLAPAGYVRPLTAVGLPMRVPEVDFFDDGIQKPTRVSAERPHANDHALTAGKLALGSLLHALPRRQEPELEQSYSAPLPKHYYGNVLPPEQPVRYGTIPGTRRPVSPTPSSRPGSGRGGRHSVKNAPGTAAQKLWQRRNSSR